jgi:hypothetical protein
MGSIGSTHDKPIKAYESIIAFMKMHPGTVLIDCMQYFTKPFSYFHFLVRRR